MAINWTILYEKYKGHWVTLKDDEKTVISSGKTAREAWEKAKKKGFASPILTNVPANLNNYIG